ncbi:MAG TPA: four helix bundle protein [Saprospiraceae bacterium]|nr:four helix bundle protein [Saprospiraceae bacterium]
MGDFRKLIVYQKAFDNAMLIFEMTKSFPDIERYSLTTQIRNSSRSVCSNIAEGYRKRLYRKHFISKTTDADMENSETLVWLDFSLSCKYIIESQHHELVDRFIETGRLLNHMLNNPEKYLD